MYTLCTCGMTFTQAASRAVTSFCARLCAASRELIVIHTATSAAIAMDAADTIARCVALLSRWKRLTESQITSLYTTEAQELIPEVWYSALLPLPYETLVHLVERRNEVPESSLREFLSEVRSLYPNYPQFTAELTPTGVETTGMSPKKLHEVRRLSALIDRLAQRLKTDTVVDLGAGLCYLSHFLSTKCGLSVVGVEAKEANAHAARARTQFIAQKQSADPPPFQVLSQHVSVADFPSFCSSRCVLVGLHTCGDLAATSLRMFSSLPSIQAVINVGCCYNLLSERIAPEAELAAREYIDRIGTSEKGTSLDHTLNSEDSAGFPMSNYMKTQFPQFFLGRLARLLGLSDMSESLLASPQTQLEKFSFRAAFQWLLRRYRPDIATTVNVGRRIKQYRDFSEYVAQICARTRISLPLSASELNATYEREFRAQEKRAGVLWVLRALLGPVVESLLLSDRVQFLQEQGLKTEVWTVFDREISPRCVAITAARL